MKIKLKVIEPEIVNDLIDSNNQYHVLFDVLSNKITKLESRIQSLENENKRKKSMEF